jgi:uncharacterized protein
VTATHSGQDEPTGSNPSRIFAIDLLRGVALLGIVGPNIVLYDIDSLADIGPAFTNLPVSVVGAPFMLFTLIFVVNKMMAVFSMLFGCGLLIVTDRAESRADRGWKLYFRRNLILLGIGIAHMQIWVGDILTVYALCALVLYFCRKLPARILIIAGLLIWYWAPVLWLLSDLGPEGDEYFSRALSMMLLGMGLYRMEILTGQRSINWYRSGTIICMLVGLPMVSLAWLSEPNALAVNNIGAPAVAVGYVCAVMWLCKSNVLASLQKCLAAAGQMALTNYLAQTLIGIGFYRLLKHMGREPNASLLGLGMLTIWILQLTWSSLWLRQFQYGPLEWLWRMGSYAQRFPMRRDPAATA